MPNSLPLVQLQLLAPLMQGLKAKGVDPEPVLESVGLTMAAYEEEGASVHVMVMHQFVENCAKATQDSTFCAKIGSELNPSGWPMIQMAMKQAETLGEFLNIYVAEATKVASSATPYIEVRGGIVTFGETRRFEPQVKPAQNDGFMIGLMLAILEKMLGDQIQPAKVTLVLCDPTVLPARLCSYQALAGSDMGAKIQFPTDWLSIRLSSQRISSEPLSSSISGIKGDLLSDFRHLLTQIVGHGDVNVVVAAQSVRMSPKKLNRCLAPYGTNASTEILHTKMTYAKDKLSNSDQTIEEIASALGYNDPSNFSRAFSKLFGQSPSRYRVSKKVHLS